MKKLYSSLKEAYADVHNKDYDHEVDRKVAKVLIPLYAESVPADALPAFYQTIQTKYKGNYDAYIDALYDNSIFSNDKTSMLSSATLPLKLSKTTLQYNILLAKMNCRRN